MTVETENTQPLETLNEEQEYQNLVNKIENYEGDDWTDALEDAEITQDVVLTTTKAPAPVQEQEQESPISEPKAPQLVPLEALIEERKHRQALQTLIDNQEKLKADTQQEQNTPTDFRQDATQRVVNIAELMKHQVATYAEKVTAFKEQLAKVTQEYEDGDLDPYQASLKRDEIKEGMEQLKENHNATVGEYNAVSNYYATLAKSPDADQLAKDLNVIHATQNLVNQNSWADNLSSEQFDMMVDEAANIFNKSGKVMSVQGMIDFRTMIFDVGKNWRWDVLFANTQSAQMQAAPPQQANSGLNSVESMRAGIKEAIKSSAHFPPNTSMTGQADTKGHSNQIFDKVRQAGSYTIQDIDHISDSMSLADLAADLDR